MVLGEDLKPGEEKGTEEIDGDEYLGDLDRDQCSGQNQVVRGGKQLDLIVLRQ